MSSSAHISWSSVEGKFENSHYEEDQQNDWHFVTITKIGHGTYEWLNEAGVTWIMYDEGEGNYRVDPENTYASYGFEKQTATFDDRGQIISITGPFGESYDRVSGVSTYSVDFEGTFYYSDIEAIRELFTGDEKLNMKISAIIPGSDSAMTPTST
jgi:hypothetical protein